MNEPEIKLMLDRLYDLQAAQDAIRLRFDDLRKSILTPEIKAALDDIAAEEKLTQDIAASSLEQLKEQIKNLVLENGGTVKGAHLQAIYNQGRISWDTKSLDGFAAAHPEISAFRKVGRPSVTIR